MLARLRRRFPSRAADQNSGVAEGFLQLYPESHRTSYYIPSLQLTTPSPVVASLEKQYDSPVYVKMSAKSYSSLKYDWAIGITLLWYQSSILRKGRDCMDGM